MFDAEPEGWQQATLGEIVALEYGRALPEVSRLHGDVPVYGSNGPVGSHAEYLVAERGIVVGRKGTAGSVHVTNGAFWPIDTTYYVRPLREVDFDWLAASLRYADLGSLHESTGVPGLNRENAYRHLLLVPPLDEQRRIAEVLRSVDEAIATAQAAVDQARRLLDGCLSALMEGGVAAFAQPASRALPQGWSEGRCDTYFILQRGFDITEGQAIAGPFRVFSSSGPSYSHREAAVEGPAVITGRKGRLGTVFYSVDPCWPHDTTLWVKDFKGNHPRFVYWKLREMKLDAYDAATSVPTLNRNNVHALTIRFPPLTEQSEIAEILDGQEDAAAQSAAAVDALLKAKAVLTSDLLSGRVRVPV